MPDELDTPAEPAHAELALKIDAVRDAQTTITGKLETVEGCLVGDPLSDPPVRGLVQRTVELEEWRSSTSYWIKRLFWLGLVAVLGLFASLLWEVIRSNIEGGP